MALAHPPFSRGVWRPSLSGVLAMLMAACGAAASLILVPGMNGAIGAALALLMASIAYVDARSFTIPDELTVVGMALAVVQAVSQDGDVFASAVAHAALRGAVLVALFWLLRVIYRWLRGRDGLGFGDVKLAGVAGAWLSWMTIPLAIEVAALSGIIVYAVRQYGLGRPLRFNNRLPFGAFFAPAIWLAWVFETVIVNRI